MSDLKEAVLSASRCMAFDSRDWSARSSDAWLYGLLCGWDCDDVRDHDEDCREAMSEIAARFGWSQEEVARLRRLRAAVLAVEAGRVIA